MTKLEWLGVHGTINNAILREQLEKDREIRLTLGPRPERAIWPGVGVNCLYIGAAPSRTREVKERFLRESQPIAQIEHENVVRFYEVGHEEARIWLAMELLNGQSLRASAVDAARASGGSGGTGGCGGAPGGGGEPDGSSVALASLKVTLTLTEVKRTAGVTLSGRQQHRCR
jgi:hypothetical protein